MLSMNVKAILKSQNDIHDKIKHAFDNVKKTDPEYSTVEIEYNVLEENWYNFEVNHQTLRDTHWEALSDHVYVKADFYRLAELTYMNQREAFLKFLTDPRNENADEAGASTSKTAGGSSHIKLPRLELPQFAGTNDDWLSFRDFFKAFIDDASLSAVHKFLYLKTSLKGEASQSIEYIPITEEGYSQAWKILTERYGNKRLLLQRCLNEFTSMPKMKNESVSELERVYYGMLRTIGTLKRLGRPVSNNTAFFVYFVVELFDMDTRHEWETATWDITHEFPSLDTLKSFLQRRINVLEALSLYKPNPDSSSKKKMKKGKKTFRARGKQRRFKGNGVSLI